MSIVILEGADGTGKTSHANYLAQQTNALLWHASAPKSGDWFTEYVKPLQEKRDYNIVCDRWHLGEMIWPVLFGRKSLFEDEKQFRLCNENLNDLGAIVKIVWRNPDDIARTLWSRGEQAQIDNVLKSQDMFVDLFNRILEIPCEVVLSDQLEREL